MSTRKTSVEINEELLSAVQRILATTTIKETIEEAFREVLRVEDTSLQRPGDDLLAPRERGGRQQADGEEQHRGVPRRDHVLGGEL